MESISKKEINFRIGKIKNKALNISELLIKNNEEIKNRYNFAQKLGINSQINNSNDNIIEELQKYIRKIQEIMIIVENLDEEYASKEYKLLNNKLYLDDIKLKNINELVKENRELNNKIYINKIGNKANELIRAQEIKQIDFDIKSISKKGSFIDKITGKVKIKRALIQNYTLKRAEVANKKYIPEDKSILEIVNIIKNCGFTSESIENFINILTEEYKIEGMVENSLAVINNKVKIPFFFNKEFLDKLNIQNTDMLDRLNENKRKIIKTAEIKLYTEVILNEVSTLELFNFSNVIEEVV